MSPAAAGLFVDAYVSPNILQKCELFFFALGVVRFLSPFMIWDSKRVVCVPNRGLVRFLNLTIHYVNGNKIGIG